MRGLIAQLTRFGTVGLVGLIVDVVVFNVLRSTVLAPDELHSGPFIAKLISTSIAIAVNWMGNRHWTFREHRRREVLREGAQFAIVSVGGMSIALCCLWVSHYLLGFTSVIADNVSSNVIGLALGTAFRFWLYRVWVFRPGSARPGAPSGAGPVVPGAPSGAGPVVPGAPSGAGLVVAAVRRAEPAQRLPNRTVSSGGVD